MTASPSARRPRSPTRCSPPPTKLRVIGRAGIGVDNVDVPAATAKGIIVMNTPFGNSITTAEHAIAHDVRASPASSPPPTPRPRPASGRRTASWASRSPARRSASSAAAISARSSPTARIGLKMKVIAFDPFLSEERAVELGVDKVELDELFRRADFITLHTPLTDKTQEHHRRRGDREDEGRRAHHQLRPRRPGRRGGRSPRRSSPARSPAPASTSSSTEPAKASVAVRPAERRLHAASRRLDHRGAGERRAPGRRADVGLSGQRRRLQRAQHAVDLGRGGAAADAVRARSPSSSARSPASSPRPASTASRIEYAGDVADMNTRALTAALLAGLLRPMLADGQHGLRAGRWRASAASRSRRCAASQRGAYETYIRLTVTHRAAGALGRRHRVLRRPAARHPDQGHQHGGRASRRHMLYITNRDKPGFIGRLGTLLGDEGVNIATFNLGRVGAGRGRDLADRGRRADHRRGARPGARPRRRRPGEAAELLSRAAEAPWVTTPAPRTAPSTGSARRRRG